MEIDGCLFSGRYCSCAGLIRNPLRRTAADLEIIDIPAFVVLGGITGEEKTEPDIVSRPAGQIEMLLTPVK